MARKSRPSVTKRQKEMARQLRQQEKQARRVEMKERQATVTERAGDEDPDIAGINPGPQPPPAWADEDRRRS